VASVSSDPEARPSETVKYTGIPTLAVKDELCDVAAHDVQLRPTLDAANELDRQSGALAQEDAFPTAQWTGCGLVGWQWPWAFRFGHREHR
jgi:hypothetical protein